MHLQKKHSIAHQVKMNQQTQSRHNKCHKHLNNNQTSLLSSIDLPKSANKCNGRVKSSLTQVDNNIKNGIASVLEESQSILAQVKLSNMRCLFLFSLFCSCFLVFLFLLMIVVMLLFLSFRCPCNHDVILFFLCFGFWFFALFALLFHCLY